MKRVGLVLTGLCMVSFLTGCGGTEKKLECTIESGSNLKQVYTMNFDKKDNFASAVLKQDMVLGEEVFSAQDIDALKKEVGKSWEKQPDVGTLNYKVTDNGKDTVTLTVDFDKADVKKIAGSDKAKLSDVQEQLEKSKYTCKVIK